MTKYQYLNVLNFDHSNIRYCFGFRNSDFGFNIMKRNMDALYSQLKSFGHVKANESLAKYTTFKIGGSAMFLVEVEDAEKLVGLLNFLVGEGVEYLILAGGSNLLLPDEGVDGVVIKVKSEKLKVKSE